MRQYRGIVSVVALLLVGLIGCTQNPLGTDNNDNGNNVVTVGFNVSGKLLDKDGKPIVGARAVLSQSGLSAITDANGEYKIQGQGTVHKSLAKRTAVASADSGATDTLIVTVPNEQGSKDSSEVVKQVVTSGVVMELPTTYIVQREIRGYLSPDDAKQISRIEAVLYDNAVPDQQKHIDLWHDTLNKAFHSFAYFSSATNKTYTLFVKVYDTANHYVGRSPDFSFPDQAGNIVFANPFNWSNAKPIIDVVYPSTVATGTDSVKVTVTAIDSMGGQIVACKINLDGIHELNVPKSAVLSKKTTLASGINADVYVGTVSIPMTQYDSSKTVVIAIDNDGNISQEGIKMASVDQKVLLSFDVFKNGMPVITVMEKDVVELSYSLSVEPEVPFTVTKTEWYNGSTVIGTTPSIDYVIPKTPSEKCSLSVKVETSLGTSTVSSVKVISVTNLNVIDTNKVVIPTDTSNTTTQPNTIVIRDVNIPMGVVSISGIELYKPIQKSEYSIDSSTTWTAFDCSKPFQIPWPTTVGTHTCTFKIVASSGQEYTKSVQKIVQ